MIYLYKLKIISIHNKGFTLKFKKIFGLQFSITDLALMFFKDEIKKNQIKNKENKIPKENKVIKMNDFVSQNTKNDTLRANEILDDNINSKKHSLNKILTKKEFGDIIYKHRIG